MKMHINSARWQPLILAQPWIWSPSLWLPPCDVPHAWCPHWLRMLAHAACAVRRLTGGDAPAHRLPDVAALR